VMLVAFAVIESRVGERALAPRDVIRNRNFAAACLTVLLMSAVFFAALLYLPQFMTKSLGYSALRAGAGLLPMMVTFAAVSFAAGSLYGRLGPKIVVSAGVACCAVGMLLLSFLKAGDHYTDLLPGLFILGIGFGLFYSSVTTAGVTALDPARASLAGGIVYMFQIAGGSVGLGVNTAIVLSGVGGSLAHFVDGIGDAFRVDAILAFCGLAVSLLFVGGRVSAEQIRQHRPHLHRAHPG
jgi:MFS family permease